jgi:hypothetical protein
LPLLKKYFLICKSFYILQNYENALEDLDEEGQQELYQSILAFMKDSEDSLGLHLADNLSRGRVTPPPLAEAASRGEVEVANASTETDTALVADCAQTAKVENEQARQENVEDEQARQEDVEDEQARQEDVEDEEDPEQQTKRLLEEAAAESSGKR